jgi:hypothetical protein
VLRDNGEPFVILRRLFHFADATLEQAKPDFICTHEYATALNGVLWLAAHRRGIACLSVRFSKINSGNGYWSLDRKLFNIAAIERATARREAGAPVSAAAKTKIEKFRARPETVDYIANKWRGQAQRNFLKWHVQYARTTARETLNRLRGQDRALAEPLGSRLARYYLQLLMGSWQRRFFSTFDESELEGMSYVYFPMHKEAEIAQTMQATQWYDQRNTVRVLASLLPFGYRLLIREHRLNFGHRPTHSYRELVQIPNVVMIDPFDSQFKYLRNADLIVTENGSSGWEGLLLGRRVLLLGKTFYAGAGRGVSMSDPDRLNATILDMLAKPLVARPEAHDYGLGCMIDGELETTFPMHREPEAISAALDMLDQTVAVKLRPRSQSSMRSGSRIGMSS